MKDIEILNSSKWKKISAGFVCIFALIFALPNFSKNLSNNISWLPNQTMNLGLDLKGGSQLLLKVDFESYLSEQLDLLMSTIRQSLLDKKIGYLKLKIENKKILFSLRNSENRKDLDDLLKNLSNSIDVDNDEGNIAISYSDQFLVELKNTVIEQSIEIVRRRIDETGTREPSIQKQGDDYILLQVPGLSNPEQLKVILGKTAKLTFHLVDETISPNRAKTFLPNDVQFVPYEKSKDPESGFAVKKKISLSGDLVTNAKAMYADQNKAVVNLSLNNIGAKQFAKLTRDNVGKALAIILDNKIISVATINEPISGGNCMISGNFTIESANELALLLRAGALPAPISIEEERVVGPNLGSDSIESGKAAALISTIMIMVFMVMTYGIAGIFANIALFMNLILIVAILSLMQATLTLPGIAGMILTMGMAVDANVLIFERIREELRLGSSIVIATHKGFKQAFTTIFDSNITTIIVAFLLYSFGTGAIKGFAVTLTIGILSSMFSAISLTKIMMNWWIQTYKPSKMIL